MEFTEGEKQAMKLLCEIGICMRIMFLKRYSVNVKCGSDCLHNQTINHEVAKHES